jgi:hypothetical protein
MRALGHHRLSRRFEGLSARIDKVGVLLAGVDRPRAMTLIGIPLADAWSRAWTERRTVEIRYQATARSRPAS